MCLVQYTRLCTVRGWGSHVGGKDVKYTGRSRLRGGLGGVARRMLHGVQCKLYSMCGEQSLLASA